MDLDTAVVPCVSDAKNLEVVTKKRMHIFSGRCNEPLAAEIAADLGVPLGQANLVDFANGELKCKFDDSLRGGDVFIIQTHSGFDGGSVNDAIMEQLIMIDAARRASAQRITFRYSCTDRKSAALYCWPCTSPPYQGQIAISAIVYSSPAMYSRTASCLSSTSSWRLTSIAKRSIAYSILNGA